MPVVCLHTLQYRRNTRASLVPYQMPHRALLTVDLPVHTGRPQVEQTRCMPLAAAAASRVTPRPRVRPAVRCSAADANLADLANKLPKVERPAGIQRRTLINMAGVAAAASLCPCTLCTPAANAGEGAGPWEYGQLEGPKNWGGVCQIGASQSPIDVPLSQLFVRGPNPGEGMGPIDFDYPAAGRAAVLNTGHGTMQVGVQ